MVPRWLAQHVVKVAKRLGVHVESFYMTQLFPKGGWGKVRTMKPNPDGRPKSWEATVIDEDRPMGMSSQQHQTQHQKVQVLYLDIGYKCSFKQHRFILPEKFHDLHYV